MKNVTTPRTLADASFTTGYSRAEIRRSAVTWERVMLAMAIGVIGAMLFGGL